MADATSRFERPAAAVRLLRQRVWAFIGWQILVVVSFITIIGWAWVSTAWMRWICRNIQGTRREIVFNASGLEVLWRTIVFAIACVFIIPIPWVYALDSRMVRVAIRTGRTRPPGARLSRSLALAQRAFLRHGSHQRAVLLEDHAAGEPAAGARAR